MQKRKIHTKAFKLEAVRLLDRGDKPALHPFLLHNTNDFCTAETFYIKQPGNLMLRLFVSSEECKRKTALNCDAAGN